jgi:hypothetical protein
MKSLPPSTFTFAPAVHAEFRGGRVEHLSRPTAVHDGGGIREG